MGPPRPPAGVHGWWALHPTVPAWVWGPQHRHPAETTDFSWCGQALQPGHRGSEKAHPLCPELSKTGTPLPGLQEPLPASQLGTGASLRGGGGCAGTSPLLSPRGLVLIPLPQWLPLLAVSVPTSTGGFRPPCVALLRPPARAAPLGARGSDVCSPLVCPPPQEFSSLGQEPLAVSFPDVSRVLTPCPAHRGWLGIS